MTRSSTSRTQILSLSLAFLLTGLIGCSKDSKGEETGGTPAQETAATAPEAPAQTGPAAPSPAQPGAAPPAADITPAVPADTGKMPAVVARVNGMDIKKEELLRQAAQMQARVAQASGGRQVPTLNDSFYKEILDGLVAQTLILQDAARQGVTVTDQEVKTQMEALKKRFPDAATFQKALSAQGLTEQDLEQNLRREALTQKYLSTKVFNEVKVSDQAAKEFYDQNQGQMQRPERAHLRHILVQVEPNAPAADKEKARAKAEDLLKRAQGGEDFGKLASENSDDPGSKGRGGDLSWIARGQTVPPFEKAAFALTKPNELSPVVESQFGYHVIQLVEREAASTVPFEEAKGRITQMLQQKQAGEKLQARVEQLKKQGKVEVFL
jgi:peptidyl-prolyl cis-trans isomerase C